MNKTLDDALAEAKAIEAELQRLDGNDTQKAALSKRQAELQTQIDILAKPEAHERKMRFADNGGEQDRVEGLFHKKPNIRSYGLEDIGLLRRILAARGGLLPDTLEDRFQSLISSDKIVKQTLTTDGTGTGAELLDTAMFPNLFNDIIASTLVASLFTPWINMTSKAMELPSLGDVTFYKPAGEGQAVTATDLATAKRTITAYTVKGQVDVSDEESEDAIVALIPEIRLKLIQNAKDAIDSVILNADTTGTTGNINKYGAAVVGTEQYLLGFDGLIHYCKNEVTGQVADIGTLETADFATLLGLLGKYADTPERCAFIVDRWSHLKAMQLDDFRTMDKIGDQATLIKGMVGGIYGVPVIMSSTIAKSDANGRIDGVTAGNNTKGRIVLVNRDMWKFGVRRSISVATERSEAKGLTSIVVTLRIGLQCFGDRSNAAYSHVALGYNVTI